MAMPARVNDAGTVATPKFELVLTSLVVFALVVGAAIVTIASVTRSGNAGSPAAPGAVSADDAMAYNKAEAAIANHDPYPFCQNGDRNLAGNQGRQRFGRDGGPFGDSGARTSGQDNLAAVRDGKAAEVGFMAAARAADTLSRPMVAFGTVVGDLGCGVGNYK